MLLEEVGGVLEQTVEPAAGLRGDGDQRRALPQLRLDPRPHVLDRDVGLVPLREHDERRVAGLPGHVGDGEILVDDPLARVDQDERHVGALGGLERAQLRVVVDPLALLSLSPQAGRVDQLEDPPVPLEDRVDGVPGRAGHVGDDHALRADEGVQQRRLADVRTPEDRDADRLVADLRRALAGEQVDDAVEQVAGAVAVQGGERERVAEAELVELDRLEVLARVVDLVREHDHRLLRGPQGDRQLLVARRDPVPGVDDEEDEVGLLDRRARLLRDLGAERVGGQVVDAARVDQEEVLAVPVRRAAPCGRG